MKLRHSKGNRGQGGSVPLGVSEEGFAQGAACEQELRKGTQTLTEEDIEGEECWPFRSREERRLHSPEVSAEHGH